MIDLEKTVQHRVYKTEQLGDALVVTLQGDAPGFSIGAVHNEMSTIVGLSKSPEVRNLIVDLSGSNYYGSMILGEIVNLGQAVREQGGRIALAGTSDDMKEVLRMMRLDAMWERYPTRSMALRALANMPWQERLRPYAKRVAIAAAVLVLVTAYFVIPRKDYTPDYYQETATLWEEARKLRAHRVEDVEWSMFAQRADRKLDELKRHLNKIAGAQNEAARYLLWVVRDEAPKAIHQHLDPNVQETHLAEYYLATAKAMLDKTDLPERSKEVEKVLGRDPLQATRAANAPTAKTP